MRPWIAFMLVAGGTAAADRHVVQRGETLEHVAAGHGCAVDDLLRANDLKTTLVKPGTIVVIPTCSPKPRSRAATPATKTDASLSDEDKARAALDVIDGATWIAKELPAPGRTSTARGTSGGASGGASVDTSRGTTSGASVETWDESLGQPWNGGLDHAEHLDAGDGYLVRRPTRAYGAPHVIEHLRRAVAEVRALYPDVHTLAIGDLSAEHGGKISAHRSHQSGLDVDVGFYFTRVPEGYPAGFAAGDDRLDLEATWALLAAFARTAELAGGVEVIFLDYAVQRRLYAWALARGTPDDDLAFLLQYPRGKDAMAGLVRHWPNHADHFHVRFKSGR